MKLTNVSQRIAPVKYAQVFAVVFVPALIGGSAGEALMHGDVFSFERVLNAAFWAGVGACFGYKMGRP